MKQKSFKYWQWRTLIVLMIGYACYYFLRKNFSTAIPAMEATLGLSKAQLGAFLTANGIVYGISRFVNAGRTGRLCPRSGAAIFSGLRCENRFCLRIGLGFRIRADFRRAHEVQKAAGLPELSMGMSGDWRIACEEGATIIRIGSAIFGAR